MFVYNTIIPTFFIFIALVMILDSEKYLNVFNGGVGIIFGGIIGLNIGHLLFDNSIGKIIIILIFMTAGYQINKIKKIKHLLISGISWGSFALIIFAVLNVQKGGLIFFVIFFTLSGAFFSYFYYSKILMISGYSFIGANILFISSFYGFENVTKNMFEVFYYPFAFSKFFYLYKLNFFFFFLFSVYFIFFSIFFQKIKNKQSDNYKTKLLNNVLNESGYIFVIFFFLSEYFRIFIGNDTLFVFGISHYNWPIFTFATYWLIAYIMKQEQIDSMVDQKKTYKPFLYIFIYSLVLIPIISFLTNFGKYSLIDFFNNSIWIYIPKWIFTIIVLPISIYLLYPKDKKQGNGV